jgi:outer membrane receptor protein involved in Fe transport
MKATNPLKAVLRRCSSEAFTALMVILPLSLALGAEPADPAEPLAVPATVSPESVLFADLPMVEAASLHAQTLQEAPANVTVITADEIRTFGYRTIGEALSNVRGFYVSDDLVYTNAGLRGLSLPGDYTSRMLLMIDGHVMPDNIFSSSGQLEQDFGLDMDLVERIEVIRGPSSALYGSNGVLATINVVTRAPADQAGVTVSTETGGFGEKKLHLSTSQYLGKGANLLFSASTFHYGGRSLFFPSQDSPATNFGVAEGVDRERGYHAFTNLTWRDWSFTVLMTKRETHTPTGFYETIFNSAGNKVQTSRGFAEAAYSREFSDGGRLKWRVYYDHYRDWGRYDYDYDVGVVEDNQDLVLGDWVGSNVSYSFKPNRLGTLTIGGGASADLRASQTNFDVQPEFYEYSSVNPLNRSYGAFLQQEVRLSTRLTAFVGARFDDSKLYKPFASPRVALIYNHSPRTTYKLLYGRAFRNPNAYEAYYEAPGFSIPNPDLGPEKISTLEGTVEHRIAKRVDAVATIYRYWLHGLIEGIPAEDGAVQFNNASKINTWGAEFGLRGRPVEWMQLYASMSTQRLTDRGSGLANINSPARLAKFRLSTPLFSRKFRISTAMRYLASRATVSGGHVAPAYLTDLTISSFGLHPSFDVVLGVRNLFDRDYFDPVGLEHVSDRLPRPGRTAFVKLIWSTGE